ncbi:hypothetical protein AWV79_27125 [Cupriavidus sp. UYMMa02A]|nr:hypothetical protein AWV79_27125 [Cupriavidus sp. UYMMa02A]
MLVVLGMLGVTVSVIPVAIFAFGAFIKPLSLAFGWGRGGISATFTFLAIAVAVAMPIAGTLIDRYGSKGPGVISLLLYATGLAAVPTLLQSFGLQGLYFAACWIGATGSVSSSIAYTKIVSRRFDSHRGLALGIVTTGVAIGAAVNPMLAVYLIGRFGWQAGFYGLAVLPALVGVPIMLAIGESRNLSQSTAEAGVGQFNRNDGLFLNVLRTPTFVILLAIFLISAMAINGFNFTFSPFSATRALRRTSPPNFTHTWLWCRWLHAWLRGIS